MNDSLNRKIERANREAAADAAARRPPMSPKAFEGCHELPAPVPAPAPQPAVSDTARCVLCGRVQPCDVHEVAPAQPPKEAP